MNPLERGVLIITKLITVNKYTRVGVVVYAALMHLLVFVSLFAVMESTCAVSGIQASNNKTNIL